MRGSGPGRTVGSGTWTAAGPKLHHGTQAGSSGAGGWTRSCSNRTGSIGPGTNTLKSKCCVFLGSGKNCIVHNLG